MTYRRLYIIIDSLVKTGLKKVNVLGVEESQADLWQIYDMCQELMASWDSELTEERIGELEEIIAELPLLQRVQRIKVIHCSGDVYYLQKEKNGLYKKYKNPTGGRSTGFVNLSECLKYGIYKIAE